MKSAFGRLKTLDEITSAHNLIGKTVRSQLHAADVPFLWSTTTSYPGANNRGNPHVSFAVTHDPNPLRAANAPFWPSYLSPNGGSCGSASGENVGFTALEITDTTIGVIVDEWTM
jgi:hypothetical protein